MANLQVKDGAAAAKYLKSSGAGTDLDPHVPEHLETNSAAIKTAVEIIDNAISGNEMQVDVVTSALPTGAATAANQTTGNTSLASLETKIGEVQASPTANTLLDRLKAIATALAGTLTVATHAVTQSGTWTVQPGNTPNTTAWKVDGSSVTQPVSGTITANAGTNLNTSALLTESDFDTKVGSLTETAPATDTASSGLNGRLQRIAQRLTSLIALLPTSLTGSGNLKTAVQEALPAGENLIGLVSTSDTVVDLTASLDTVAYASGDVLFDTQELASAARVNAGVVTLQNIVIIDEDDQGVAFDIYFLDANNSLGTENSAPNISDANARNILGYVTVNTTDYKDLGGVKIAILRNLGLVMKAGSGTTSLYVAGVNGTGTPTFTASGLRFRFGFMR